MLYGRCGIAVSGVVALIEEQQRLILELRAEIEQLKEIAESAGRTVFQE